MLKSYSGAGRFQWGGGTKQTKQQQPATNEVRCDSVVARKALASKR